MGYFKRDLVIYETRETNSDSYRENNIYDNNNTYEGDVVLFSENYIS